MSSRDSQLEKAHTDLHEHVHHNAALEVDELDVAPLDAINFDDDPHLDLKTILACVAGCFGGGMQLFVLLSVGTNILYMAKSLGNFPNLVWYINCMAVTTAAVGPAFGQISDLFGRRYILIFTQCCGVVGGIVGATAKSWQVLMLASTILGFSLGSQALFYAIPSETLPRKWRAWGSYGLTTVSSLMSIAAVMASGAVNKYNVGGVNEGWRVLLYCCSGVIGMTGLILIFCYFPPPRPNPDNLSFMTRVFMIDWLGIFILIAGITVFLLGLNWGGGAYPWKSVQVIVPIIVGLLTIVGFVVYSLMFKKTGILNRELFLNSRGYAVVCFLVFVEGLVYASFSTYYGQQTSILYESDPVIAATRALPFFAMYLIAGPVVNWYATKYKDLVKPTVFGFGCFTVAYIGMSVLKLGPASGNAFIFCDVLAGLGFSAAFPLLIVLGQLDTPGHLIGVASAFVLCVRVIGTGVGICVYSVIVNSKLATSLGPEVAAAVLPLGLPTDSLGPLIGLLSLGEPVAALSLPGMTPQILGVAFAAFQRAYSYSFKFAWIASIPFCVLGMASCYFLPNVGNRFDGRIDHPMKNAAH